VFPSDALTEVRLKPDTTDTQPTRIRGAGRGWPRTGARSGAQAI
jgi:hypothetical protein